MLNLNTIIKSIDTLSKGSSLLSDFIKKFGVENIYLSSNGTYQENGKIYIDVSYFNDIDAPLVLTDGSFDPNVLQDYVYLAEALGHEIAHALIPDAHLNIMGGDDPDGAVAKGSQTEAVAYLAQYIIGSQLKNYLNDAYPEIDTGVFDKNLNSTFDNDISILGVDVGNIGYDNFLSSNLYQEITNPRGSMSSDVYSEISDLHPSVASDPNITYRDSWLYSWVFNAIGMGNSVDINSLPKGAIIELGNSQDGWEFWSNGYISLKQGAVVRVVRTDFLIS